MSPYSKYSPRSFGRILHFIYHYSCLRYAEQVCLEEGGRKITYYGKPFASLIEWKDIEIEGISVSCPIFRFRDEIFNRNQSMLQRQACMDTHQYRNACAPKTVKRRNLKEKK